MTAATTAPLRRLPLPVWEPPYDDEVARSASARRSDSGPAARCGAMIVQGTLALAFVLPSGATATPAPPPDLRLLPDPAAADIADECEFGPQPTARADLCEPREWAGRFVQAVVEVMARERPATQLVRWTSRDVYDDLSQRVVGATSSAPRPVVRSVHVAEPADGVAEVAALVRRGARCVAVALRLEGLDGRWQCTALELG